MFNVGVPQCVEHSITLFRMVKYRENRLVTERDFCIGNDDG